MLPLAAPLDSFLDSFPQRLCARCPVVAFNVGGVREGMIPSETGIIVDEISVDALTAALKYLLSDPVLLQRMSVRAAAHVRERFSWEMVAQRVIRACDAAVIGRH